MFIDENKIMWLIPTYNEELSIKDVIANIPIGVPYVFDKSMDKTPFIAKRAGAIVIHRKGNGKGEAVREGIELLKPLSDIIVIIDGDNTYSPSEIYKLIDALKNGADMAVGSRLLGRNYRDAMGITHRLGNRFFNFLINIFFDASLTDFLSGFRAFYAQTIDPNDISAKGFDIEVELTTMCLRNGLKIIEVPITYSKREHSSDSKLNMLTDGLKILLSILQQFFRSFT